MSRSKIIILVIILVVLTASLGYLTDLVQKGDDPLTLLNLRAANEEEDLTDPLLAQDESPTPTLSFTSTSPTASPSASLIAPSVTITTAVSPRPSASPTASPSPTVEAVMTITPTPTQIAELPVSGITDYLDVSILGGVALILLAFVL